jgi:hypothetical protein
MVLQDAQFINGAVPFGQTNWLQSSGTFIVPRAPDGSNSITPAVCA